MQECNRLLDSHDSEYSFLEIARARLLLEAFNWGMKKPVSTNGQLEIPILRLRLPLESNTHSDFRHFNISNDNEAYAFILLNLLSDNRLRILDSKGQTVSFETFKDMVKSYDSMWDAATAMNEKFTVAIYNKELEEIEEKIKNYDVTFNERANILFSKNTQSI